MSDKGRGKVDKLEADNCKKTRELFDQMPTSIPDNCLFDLHATAAGVLHAIVGLIPALAHTQPAISALRDAIRSGKQHRPVFHHPQHHPQHHAQQHSITTTDTTTGY
jgi:hypothetical protein